MGWSSWWSAWSAWPVRKRRLAVAAAAIALGLAVFAAVYRPFPSDRTPEGAYMRVARAVAEDHPEHMFAYLDRDAQWASYSVRDARRAALEAMKGGYPEDERARLEAEYRPFADAPDGKDVFARYYRARGWDKRLRKDLSGVVRSEVEGERASVVTARGTRYAFKRRPENGIWGLTGFTAELLAESERAARDLAVVQAAARDWQRGDAGP